MSPEKSLINAQASHRQQSEDPRKDPKQHGARRRPTAQAKLGTTGQPAAEDGLWDGRLCTAPRAARRARRMRLRASGLREGYATAPAALSGLSR